jgi:hypothetical protein
MALTLRLFSEVFEALDESAALSAGKGKHCCSTRRTNRETRARNSIARDAAEA